MDYRSIFESNDYFDQLVADWEQKNGSEFPFTQSELHGVSECYFDYKFDLDAFEEVFAHLDKLSQDKFMLNFLYDQAFLVDFVDEEDFEQDPTHHVICTNKLDDTVYIAVHQNRYSYEVYLDTLVEAMEETFDLKFDRGKNEENLFADVIEKTCHLTSSGRLHDKLTGELNKAESQEHDIIEESKYYDAAHKGNLDIIRKYGGHVYNKVDYDEDGCEMLLCSIEQDEIKSFALLAAFEHGHSEVLNIYGSIQARIGYYTTCDREQFDLAKALEQGANPQKILESKSIGEDKSNGSLTSLKQTTSPIS